MSEQSVVIVGAGLVGSLQAIFMRKRGYEVSVFEKRPDMRKDRVDAGRSINLVVTSRGIHALQQVGLWREIQKECVPVHGRMMHSPEGELTYQPYGKDKSECNYSISRGELNKILMTEAEKAGAKIYFQHPLESADFEGKQIVFQDEVNHCKRTVQAERIFATDGAGSVVRKSLLKANIVKEKIEPLGASYKELTIPAGENGQFLIEKNALHIWPRGHHMLMALPNLDGSFTVTLYLPEEGGDSFGSINSKEDLKSFFEKHYQDAIPLLKNLEDEFFANPTGILATVRCEPWHYKSHVALLGDAAHAVVPFFGQGMNCGFEDCTYLDRLLNENNDNWEKVLPLYTEVQKPNGDAIADMAIENFVEMRDKVGDKKFLLRKKVEHLLENEFPDLYRTRYAMVTYTLVPYELAKRCGELQTKLLDELTAEMTTIEDLDIDRAKKMIDEKITPFYQQNKIMN